MCMNRQQALETMKNRVEQWGADLEALEARAEYVGAASKAELRSTIADLKQMRTKAVGELDRLQASTDDAFDDMRRGVEKAWEGLAQSFQEARRRYN
jgi:hypothetical protein